MAQSEFDTYQPVSIAFILQANPFSPAGSGGGPIVVSAKVIRPAEMAPR
jgi:hypothetical protein